MNELKLKIAEQKDKTKKYETHLSSGNMKKLGLSDGDVVMIVGGRETVSFVRGSSECGQDSMILDPHVLKNSGSSPGDAARIAKVSAEDAESVVISAPDGMSMKGDPRMFINDHVGKPLIEGDVLGANFGAEAETIPMIGGLFGGMLSLFSFTVEATEPSGVVILRDRTHVTLLPPKKDDGKEAGGVSGTGDPAACARCAARDAVREFDEGKITLDEFKERITRL